MFEFDGETEKAHYEDLSKHLEHTFVKLYLMGKLRLSAILGLFCSLYLSSWAAINIRRPNVVFNNIT